MDGGYPHHHQAAPVPIEGQNGQEGKRGQRTVIIVSFGDEFSSIVWVQDQQAVGFN